MIVEQVPAATTFVDGESTAGWTCERAEAGALCRFDVGVLAPGASREVTYAVRVDEGTDPAFDIYNEAAAGLGLAPRGQRAADGQGACEAGGENAACGSSCVPSLPGTCIPNTPAFALACCYFGAMKYVECLTDQSENRKATSPAFSPRQTPPSLEGHLLYRFRDHVLATTTGGRRATALFYRHTNEMARLGLENPTLTALSLAAMRAWEPVVRALVEGRDATITTAQVDALGAALDAMAAVASPVLQRAIARGRAQLDLATFPGLSATAALDRLDRLACPEGRTAESLRCRVADLADAVAGRFPAGTLQSKLLRLAEKARTATEAAVAAQPTDAGRARRLLRVAAKRLGAARKRARSRSARKALPPGIRGLVTEPVPALQADLRALARGGT